MRFIFELLLVCILVFIFGVGLGTTIHAIIPDFIHRIF